MTAIMQILDSVIQFIQTGCIAGKAIKTIFQWINDYNGALMVLTTLIYVIATIFISFSNKKSADAAREQIAESQKQQKQNVGLQLYDRRKEVIENISQKKYDEAVLDVQLLFNKELFDSFEKIALKGKKIEELNNTIGFFELELRVILGEKALVQIMFFRNRAVNDEDIGQLKEAIIQALNSKGITADLGKQIEEYIRQVTESKELERQQEAETEQLLLQLKDFMKKSIK